MNRQDAIEAVAQAYCTDENSRKVMDSTLAQTTVDNIMQRVTSEAFEVLKQAMIDDNPSKPGSLAHSWHCNIAMMCHDAIRAAESMEPDCLAHEDAHEVGNDAASRFMKLCFDVETSA